MLCMNLFLLLDDHEDRIIGCDYNFNNILVCKTGVVTTLAGSGSASDVDGTGLSASFKYPADVFVDSSGYIYACDFYNIRTITSEGNQSFCK